MKLTIIVLLIAPIASAEGRPPKLLTDALRRLPGLTILDPKIDLRGDDLLQATGESAGPSFIEADFDHDGMVDVAAVVTARGKSETRFGVLAVLSSQPDRIFWLRPLGRKLYGVDFYKINGPDGSVAVWRDRVAVWPCVACDAGTWFRWSGRAFVAELYSGSDVLAIADQEIFSEPSTGSRVIAKSGPCLRVKALNFRGADPQTRWYFIETVEAHPKRGWVGPEVVGDPSDVCSPRQ